MGDSMECIGDENAARPVPRASAFVPSAHEWVDEAAARKRARGAGQHVGTRDDWAGWDTRQHIVAIAGELLDVLNYAEHGEGVARVEDQYVKVVLLRALATSARYGLARLGRESVEAAAREHEASATLCEMCVHSEASGCSQLPRGLTPHWATTGGWGSGDGQCPRYKVRP